MYPLSGYSGTIVTIRGNGFHSIEELCRYGSVSTKSTISLSSSEVLCPAPNNLIGSVSLEVGSSSDQVAFRYSTVPIITGIDPETASPGDTIHIFGVAFDMTTYPTCHFGKILSSSATILSSSLMNCIVPSNTDDVLSVKVSISLNNADFIESPTLFYYADMLPTISKLSPTSTGPWLGGTVLTLEGARFLPNDYCDFGSVRTPVAFQSSTMVTCVTPALPAPMNVNVGVRGQNSEPTFEFVYAPEIISIYPTTTSSGFPVMFTVYGQKFHCSVRLLDWRLQSSQNDLHLADRTHL